MHIGYNKMLKQKSQKAPGAIESQRMNFSVPNDNTTTNLTLPHRLSSLASETNSASVKRGPLFRSPLSMVAGTQTSSESSRDEYFHDKLYSVIVGALTSLFNMNCLDELATPLLAAFEGLLLEHHLFPGSSRLHALVPEIKSFLTPLPFAEAFKIYNQKYRITKRHFIPPTFHEIRHIMNIAQVMAVRHKLKLVTFDGDETLYPDGRNFDDVNTAHHITTLLERGCIVAVVTAAGYGYQTEKYEIRLQGLLQYFCAQRLPRNIVANFFLFGGESNYLIRCGPDYHLQPVPESEWRPHVSSQMKEYFQDNNSETDKTLGGNEVARFLSVAATALESAIDDLALRAVVVRKERAVGLVPGGIQGRRRRPTGSGTTSLKPEILEETVFRVRQAVQIAEPPLHIPFCAFNGGHDVWVDVGNKAEGLLVLQSYLNIQPEECLHIGDQFSVSGNDTAARDVAPTLWICNPSETKAVLRSLLRQMNYPHLHPNEFAQDAPESESEESGRQHDTTSET